MKQIQLDNNRISSGRKARSFTTQQMLHRVAAIFLLMLVSAGAWAADYVFMSGSNYIIINNSGTITTTTTFSPSCLWSGTSGGAFTNNGSTLKYSQRYTESGNTRTYSTTLNTTGTNVPLDISTDGTIQFTANVSATYYNYYIVSGWNPTPGTWYIQLDGSNVVASTNNSTNNIKAYLVTTTEISTLTHIEGIDGSSTIGKTGTFNYTKIGEAKVYSSAFTSYAFNNNTYYKVGDNITTTAPTSEEFIYTWSATCSDASYTGYSINSSNGTLTITAVPETDKEITIILTATKTGQETQTVTKVVNVSNRMPTGVDGGTVTLNDYEDHTWTYYAGVDESVDDGNYNTNYAGKMYSPDPRNVKITYQANGGAVSISESETEFVYYETIEKVNNAYKYQVIPNPFSKRPTNNGFGGWEVVSGGSYIGKNTGDVLALDEELTLTAANLKNVAGGDYTPNCTSAEIVLKATWVNANVTYLTNVVTNNNNYTYDPSTTGDYEKNILVINKDYSGTITTTKPVTITMVDPATGNRGNYTFTGNITPNNDGTTKIENAKWNPSGNINGRGRNFTIGRGMTMGGTTRTLYGSSTSAAMNQVLVVESGTFSNYRGIDATPTSHTKQHVIFGNDYDRAKNDNEKLSITGNLYGLTTSSNLGFKNASKEVFRILVKSGKFYPNPTLNNATYNNSFYLWDYSRNNNGLRILEIEGGEFGHIAGGANVTTGDAEVVNLKIRMRGGTVNGSIFGGAAQYNATGSKQFVFTGGTVKGWIAGGSNGYADSSAGSVTGYSYVYIGGNVRVDSEGSTTLINRGAGGTVFGAGCGNSSTATSGQVQSGTNVIIADNAYVERGVYGGGSFGYCPDEKTSNIYVTGGTVDSKAGGVSGTAYSSTVQGGVYGGACQNRGGIVNVYMTGGQINGGLYGGSNASGTISGNVTMQINGGQVGKDVSNTANIHGGGYGSSTKVNGNVDIKLGADNAPLGADGVVVYGDVYGGSAEGTVNTSTTNHTNVTLNAGTVNGNIFGGGLGVKDGAAADVNGNVTVTVNGGSLNIGGVFGCNNQNGTPKGTVAVTVNHTNPSEYDSNGNVTKYAINAVYGGGNQIAFAGKPVVHIVNCDCSIKEVYGGGNAADVGSDETTTNPHTDATDVTIDGGEIDYAFGGGNGSGTGNPGANVKGNSNLTIGGGTINHAFGGSNTLGDVYGNANVTLEDNNDDCPISIGEVYGGANKAPMTGKPMLTIGCLSGRLENVYGGSKAVDVNSDIVLNITSGQFGKVFGGNNESGEVKGSITVNVDETDCHPIVIDELYAGGNMAAYSTPSGKSEPTINVISCSHIGRVFGGGYGATAVVTGDPVVNINQIPGKYDPDDQDESDGYSSNTSSKLGTIGEVFGGGNAAEVVGNTTVNIGTIAKNKHISGEDLSSEYDVGANITGNVYGGGNQANVTGKTNVQIGPTE